MRQSGDEVKIESDRMNYDVTESGALDNDCDDAPRTCVAQCGKCGMWTANKLAICGCTHRESGVLEILRRGRRPQKSPTVALLVYRLFLILQFLQLWALATGNYYSGYMSSIIQNHTESACEGHLLFIRCPMMTTISIQGAMYGRKVPSNKMCPNRGSILDSPAPLRGRESVNCEAVTSLAKTAASCHEKRVCQLLVHVRVFGDDPCPGTTKYLTVNYKCKLLTEEFKARRSCRDRNTHLRCSRSNTVIAVYNVTLTDNDACDDVALKNCSTSPTIALEQVTDLCHKKQRCTIPAAINFCANFIHVDYACVPKRILTDGLPSSVLSAVAASQDSQQDDSISTSAVTSQVVTTATATSSLTSRHAVIATDVASVPQEPVLPEIRTLVSITATATLTSTLTSNVTSAGTSDETKPDKQVVTTAAPQTTSASRVKTKVTTAKPLPGSTRKQSIATFFVESEFPMPDDTIPKSNRSASSSVANSSSTSLTSPGVAVENMTIAAVPLNPNQNVTYVFPIVRSLVALATYIRGNSDRVLAVFLGGLCIGLVLVVLMLTFRCHERPIFPRKKKKGHPDQCSEPSSEEAESASLLGAAGRPSQTGSASTTPGNVCVTQTTSRSNSNGRVNHIEYMNHLDDVRAKKRSRTRAILDKWCACCHADAPWKQDVSEDGRVEHRSTSFSDDGDAISAVASGRSHFDSEPLPMFASSSSPVRSVQDEVASDSRDNPFPTAGLSEHADDDNTSEYELFNEPSSSPPSTPDPPILARPTSLRTNPNCGFPTATDYRNRGTFGNGTLPIVPSVQRTVTNPYQQAHLRQNFAQTAHIRELPPFPKTNYNYHHSPQRHYPHYATQRQPYSMPQQQNRQNQIVYHSVDASPRRPTNFPSSFHEHYVSLQPQHHQAANARTMTLNQQPTGRLERRDSFYDNSLPRDSPLYDYYQRQSRQELPGTKNLNRYYS